MTKNIAHGGMLDVSEVNATSALHHNQGNIDKGALLNTLRQSVGSLFLRAQEAIGKFKNQYYKLQYTSLFLLLGSANASGQFCLPCCLLGDKDGTESTIDYGISYSKYNNFTDIMSPDRGFKKYNGWGIEANTSGHRGIGIAQLGVGYSKMSQKENENNFYSLDRIHIEIRPMLATRNDWDLAENFRITLYGGPTIGGSMQFVEGRNQGNPLNKTTFIATGGVRFGANITLGEAVTLGVGAAWNVGLINGDDFEGIKGGYFPDGQGLKVDTNGKQNPEKNAGEIFATLRYVLE